MNRLSFLHRCLLLPLGVSIVTSFTLHLPVEAAQSAPEAGPAMAAAQAFYDGYMKTLLANGDTQAYVMKSKQATDAFKKAYQTFMKEPDADPILCAQDFPDSGFEASRARVKGDKASVEMKSRDAQFDHRFSVTLQKSAAGEWQITGTQDLPAK